MKKPLSMLGLPVSPFRHLHSRDARNKIRSGIREFRPIPERLDDRIVLTTLPTTTVAGVSVGQTIGNVVNTPSLGGLTVESTSGFSTASPPGFLNLSNNGTPFATVSYITTTGSAFQTLALPAGDPTVQLSGSTVVTQAASGTAAAGAAQSFSSTPFTLTMSGSASNFASTGYLYVQGSKGNYIVSYASIADSSGNSAFQGCMIVGSFGALNSSPFQDVINAGAFMVQSVAPNGGQTTSINSSPIVVQASVQGDPQQTYPFTLTVLSTSGFATPVAGLPRYMLVYFTDGSMAVVSYTGISPNSSGGYDLTGCVSPTAGTIGAFGATSGPTANVQWTSATPIDFEFTNDSGQGSVYLAVAGQQIDPITGVVTYGYLTPGGSGSVGNTELWRFQPFTGQTTVPTTMIFSTSDAPGSKTHVLIPNDPYKRLDSVRMVFSMGTAPVIPIISGLPSFPAAGNPSDPNDSTTYDFVEFTERSSPNDGILFINTTQVDQVGIPFLMQATPPDSVKSNGVGITVSRSELFYQFGQYITQQFAGLTGQAATSAAQAFQSLTTPNRLLNPSDAISNPPTSTDTSTFGSYFDAALTAFFNKYLQAGQTFRFQRDGFFFSGQTITGFTPAPYSISATNVGSGLLIPPNGNSPTSMVFSIGQALSGPGVPSGATITAVSVDPNSKVTTVSYSPSGTSQSGPANYTFSLPSGYTVLQLSETDSNWNVIAGGQQYQIYAPYFSNGSPYPAGFPASSATPPVAPPWIAPGSTAASAGLMVFGNLGAFADGSFQATTGQISGSNATGQILLDIQNSIVSALNRGIANAVAAGTDVTSAWNDNTTFYPPPSQDGSNWSNFYAGFLHNGGVSVTAPASPVGLAYGFAYDDQGGNDPTLVSYASKISIVLQQWTLATSIVISPSHLQTVVGQASQVTFTAYRDHTQTLVDTGYLGRIYFSGADVAAGLPEFYQFTPADNGRKTFAFTPTKTGSFTAQVSDPANRLQSSVVWTVDPARISFAVGTDSGVPAIVKLFDAHNVQVLEIVPFGLDFHGGVRVALADITSDGFDDVIAVSGPGRVTETKVFDGRSGELISSQRPFGDSFTGGGYVTTGDLTGDQIPDLVVVNGAGASSQMMILDGSTGQPIAGRNVFQAGYRGGSTVAAADLDGDGIDEIVVGAITGGVVRVFDGRTLRVKSTFSPFGQAFRGVLTVTGGDVLGSSSDEILVSTSQPRLGTSIRAFDGRGRLLTNLKIGANLNSQSPRFGTIPDPDRPGKQLLLFNGGPGDASLQSYRIVNVSPYTNRPTYRSNLTSVIYPFGSQSTSGFFLSGRKFAVPRPARTSARVKG
jgi:hypothetical protein